MTTLCQRAWLRWGIPVTTGVAVWDGLIEEHGMWHIDKSDKCVHRMTSLHQSILQFCYARVPQQGWSADFLREARIIPNAEAVYWSSFHAAYGGWLGQQKYDDVRTAKPKKLEIVDVSEKSVTDTSSTSKPSRPQPSASAKAGCCQLLVPPPLLMLRFV